MCIIATIMSFVKGKKDMIVTYFLALKNVAD